MFKKIAIGILCVATFESIRAAQTTVNFDSGLSGTHVVADQNTAANNPLTAGQANVDGDGAVLQLGYFSNATTANNFAGTWIPLSGQTSLNTAPIPGSNETFNQTSIGDLSSNGPGPGQFAISLTFDTNNPMSNNSLPAVGTPLSIRFYNGTTIANSGFYNVVSSDNTNWIWAAPADPPNNPVLNLSLDDANLEWLSIVMGQNSNTAFHTTIPIPEPSTVTSMLIGGTLLGGALIRRRRQG